ncbi:MAG TPA: DUF4388 domain-containing protein [Actinomycetota bacterium]|nr:DUF4388 domain-containing protein [Actinomycetota bacterium]
MLKGTLDDFSLPDIFRLTALAKKTGRLEVERRTGSGRIYFRDGDVYYAESTKSKEPLGRKLIRSGWVTERQLRRAVVEQEQTGRRVGEILIAQSAVDEEQIEWAVRSQIEDGVFDLLRWDLGAFVWEPDVEIEVEVPLTVTVENLIIEASRRLDEISQIKKKIPSADVVLVMAARPPDGAHQINITSEEWQVLVLVDGRRTVEDIATTTGAEAYQTTRLLFGLMNAGLIEHKQVPVGGADEFDRWRGSDEPDSNVVELQRDSDVDVDNDVEVEVEVGTQGDEERSVMTTPPAPPPAPESSPETVESEPVPPPSPRRSRGPRVDRAAVVRELAGLFNEGNKPRPRAVPSGQRDEGKPPEPTQKRRVEDDDQVDRKLIGRMIDGVKEL